MLKKLITQTKIYSNTKTHPNTISFFIYTSIIKLPNTPISLIFENSKFSCLKRLIQLL